MAQEVEWLGKLNGSGSRMAREVEWLGESEVANEFTASGRKTAPHRVL